MIQYKIIKATFEFIMFTVAYRLREDGFFEAQSVHVLGTFLPLCQVAAHGLSDGRKNKLLSYTHLGLMSKEGRQV